MFSTYSFLYFVPKWWLTKKILHLSASAWYIVGVEKYDHKYTGLLPFFILFVVSALRRKTKG